MELKTLKILNGGKNALATQAPKGTWVQPWGNEWLTQGFF